MLSVPVAPELRQANGVSKPTESQFLLTDLVAALEHAALTAKQLSCSSSSDHSHLLNAYSSLRNAHLQIGSFLARFDSPVSVAGAIQDEPMDEDDCESSKIIEKVEEGMRDCALQQRKRCKRPLSPSWAASQQLLAEDGSREASPYDPRERMRSLDLVFQFHG